MSLCPPRGGKAHRKGQALCGDATKSSGETINARFPPVIDIRGRVAIDFASHDTRCADGLPGRSNSSATRRDPQRGHLRRSASCEIGNPATGI